MVTIPHPARSASEEIPRSPGPTDEQVVLSGIAKTVFRLNGQLLSIAEDLSGPAGLTAARWQILASVLQRPLSVAEISRQVGNTRQSVQRIADLLVTERMAEYQPNPAHRRAKLLSPTAEGRSAVRRIAPAHSDLADRLSTAYGRAELERLQQTLAQLSTVLEDIQ